MFSRFKSFLYRHRNKIIGTSLVIGGAILAANYAQKKFREWQEKEAREFFKKAKKEQHCRSTERTCNQTIFSLSKSLKETVYKLLDSDVLLQRIREGEGQRIPLWEELKIVVFAQICALLYSGMMLVIFLRIQLNIIGGYMVRDTECCELSTSLQEKYLSMFQHFLEKGLVDICNLMKKHSELVLKDVSLKQKMTLQDIEQIFWRLESSLNQDSQNPVKNLAIYLIPPENGNSGVDSETQFLKKIILETIDLLKHEEVISAAESSVKRAFANTVDKIAEYYVQPDCKTASENGHVINGVIERSNKIVNVTTVTVPIAKLVPILHGLYRGPIDQNLERLNGTPDPWIEQYVLMEPLNRVGADIYDAFSFEGPI